MRDRTCRVDPGWGSDQHKNDGRAPDNDTAPINRKPGNVREIYLAGFNAAKHAAADTCKRLSENAAQQDDQHGWAWAIACQSEIQKMLPEECPK